MLAIFDASGNRIKHTYNGLDLNDPADDADDTYWITDWAESDDYYAVEEPHSNQNDGTESYGVVKLKKHLIINLAIKGRTLASLYDHVHALALAFDPALASKMNPSNEGFLPYTFNVPTEDTTHYPTGLVPSFYYLRAETDSIPPMSNHDGLSIPAQLRLETVDPARYFQTQQSQSITNSATNLDNTLASYFSYPTIQIVMGGAGSSTFMITCSSSASGISRAIKLDLSSRGPGSQVNIDCLNQVITNSAGDDITDDVFVSVVGGGWPILTPDINSIYHSNYTNVTSDTMKWYRAFVA